MLQNAKHLSRRGFLRAAGGLSAAAFLAACVPAGAPSGSGSPGQDRSLRFWMWNTYAPPADDVLEQGILAWGEENGVNVQISRDSDSDIAGKVMPALEAGTLPDALFAGAGDALRMIEADGVESLADAFKEIGDAHEGWQPRLEGYVTCPTPSTRR
jgi:ABC-type glycerol-3-phosphate transport system substrate-binding protein